MPLSPFIQKNKDAVLQQTPEMLLEPFAEFQTLRYESYLSTKGEPPCLREAKAFSYALRNMYISIEDYDLLAGSQYAAFPPIYYHYRNRRELAECIPDERDIHALHPETHRKRTRAEYEQAIHYWLNEDEYNVREKNLLTPEEKAAMDEKWCSGKRVTGHMIADYGYILRFGLDTLIQKIREKLTAESDTGKRVWYESVIIVLEGVLAHAYRWSALAQQLADIEPNRTRKKQLQRIAFALRKVPNQSADTFFEALQSFWLIHSCLMLEQMTPYASSFGRFDHYMFPFYETDLRHGRISEEEVIELLHSFYIKTLVGRDAWQVSQNLLLGGKNIDGSDASNPLSYLALRAGKTLRLVQPSLAVRIHKNSPEELLTLAFEFVREGSGLPAFHNDETVISSMIRDGFTEEDAYNYGILGCQEPGGSGNDCARSTSLKPNLLKCVELALNEGISLISKKRLGVSTGTMESFKSFDDVWDAYDKQNRRMTELMVNMEHKSDLLQAELRPVPFLSALINDCIEKGTDYRTSGAKYNFSGCLAHGLGSTADALTAIKYCVFDKKLMTLRELKEALQANFEGKYEKVRQVLKNFAPKYGNDNPDADTMVVKVAEHFRTALGAHTNTIGAKYRLWWDTPTLHEVMGHYTGATPDGRRLHDPLSYGTGPAVGAPRKGVLPAINSVGCLNHSLYGGTDISLSFQRCELDGNEGISRLGTVVKEHFGSNGKYGAHHVHINVLSIDDLKDAMEHPEKYGDLLVKFHGTSARFIDLDKATQLEFIARYESGL